MSKPKYGDIEFERRVFPRFVIHLPFTYEIDSQSGGEGITNNASQGGLQVYLAERVKKNDILRFRLSLPDENAVQSIEVVARVIWFQKSMLPPPKNYKVGLEFVEISEEALNFLRWFEQLWLKQGG